MPLAARSPKPLYGSRNSSLPTRSAIALIVKSRLTRSSSIDPGKGVKSTVCPPSSATRHAPCRSESRKGAPPVRLASFRAAARGSRTATSMSTTGRSSAWSRTAPPTIHASSSANSSSRTSTTLRVLKSRAGNCTPLSSRLVRAFTHRRPLSARADRLLVLELDGEGVHRDHPDHAPWLAADTHLRAGQVAAEPVRVADGHDPDPGRRFGDEGAAITRALARLEPLDLREVAAPGKRRLEAVRGGVLAERREPVERHAAARRVEACRRQPQRGGAVGDMAHQLAVGLGRGAEALDLLLREGRVGVGGREMRHQSYDLGTELGQL